MDIVTVIQNQQNLFAGKPANITEIKKAEKTLNVAFSKDYKEYLSVFGFATFEGHELTGLCDGRRLDIVAITNLERSYSKSISEDWYVIEQTGFDGIVIWQDSSGKVYQVTESGTIQLTYNSLSDYILNSF